MKFLDIHKTQREVFEIEEGYQPYSSIFYIVDGVFTIQLNQKEYTICSGDVLYLPKNLYFRRKIREKITFYYIRFSDDEKFSYLVGVLPTKNHTDLNRTIGYLMQAQQEIDSLAETADVILTSFLCQIALDKKSTQISDRKTEACVEYMKEHFSCNITLEELCRISDYSKPTLTQKFRRIYSATPIAFLNRIRIERAQDFLINSDFSIGEIAEKCGFNCAYYFCNAFKKQCKMSPSDYRKKYII